MIFIFTGLCFAVMLISGFSDSAGAITGCVSARSLSPEGAVRLAAVCTFTGAMAAAVFGSRVARTYYGIADFGGEGDALPSLCAALCAVMLWSVIAHSASLPTSESHALVSGMTGAALARRMSLSALSLEEWGAVLLGLLLSTLPALLLGFIFNGVLSRFLARTNRRSAVGHFRRSQRLSAAWSCVLTGAQDCQKFMGVFMLGLSLAAPEEVREAKTLHLSIVVLCAAVLTLGALLGISGTVKKLGRDMTVLDPPEHSAASAASSAVMTVCTLLGIPADTLQSRAAALFGAGLYNKKGSDPRVAAQILGAWLLTFPVCGGIGFILSYISSASARLFL